MKQTLTEGRHVALLKIQGKEYEMTPLPLRTVRPFVLESLVLQEVSDEEDLDLTDKGAITSFLKSRVNSLLAPLLYPSLMIY